MALLAFLSSFLLLVLLPYGALSFQMSNQGAGVFDKLQVLTAPVNASDVVNKGNPYPLSRDPLVGYGGMGCAGADTEECYYSSVEVNPSVPFTKTDVTRIMHKYHPHKAFHDSSIEALNTRIADLEEFRSHFSLETIYSIKSYKVAGTAAEQVMALDPKPAGVERFFFINAMKTGGFLAASFTYTDSSVTLRSFRRGTGPIIPDFFELVVVERSGLSSTIEARMLVGSSGSVAAFPTEFTAIPTYLVSVESSSTTSYVYLKDVTVAGGKHYSLMSNIFTIALDQNYQVPKKLLHGISSSATVVFDTPFDVEPVIVACNWNGDGEAMAPTSISTTGFTAQISNSGTAGTLDKMTWIAVAPGDAVIQEGITL